MLIPTIYPEELALGYVARVRNLNGSGFSRNVSCFEDNNQKKLPLSDHLGFTIADSLQMSSQEFFAKHTLHPINDFVVFNESDLDYGDSNSNLFTKNNGTLLLYSATFIRTCKTCIQEDLIKLGFSYHRRFHQIPGFDVCHIHGDILDMSRTKMHKSPDHIQESGLRKIKIDYQIDHPSIKRYRELCMSLSKRTQGLTFKTVRAHLLKQSKIRGIKWSNTEKGRLFSDLFFETYPLSWLKSLFPQIKPESIHSRHVIDRLTKKVTRPKSSIKYILALNALFERPEDVIAAIGQPIMHADDPDLYPKLGSSEFIRSEAHISAIYEKHRGSMKNISIEIGHSREHTAVLFNSFGLPSLLRVQPSTVFAFFDFQNGMSIETAATKHNLDIHRFESFIRAASKRLAQSLQKITAAEHSPLTQDNGPSLKKLPNKSS